MNTFTWGKAPFIFSNKSSVIHSSWYIFLWHFLCIADAAGSNKCNSAVLSSVGIQTSDSYYCLSTSIVSVDVNNKIDIKCTGKENLCEDGFSTSGSSGNTISRTTIIQGKFFSILTIVALEIGDETRLTTVTFPQRLLFRLPSYSFKYLVAFSPKYVNM